jgi:Zn-dependent protease with chaperone function
MAKRNMDIFERKRVSLLRSLFLFSGFVISLVIIFFFMSYAFGLFAYISERLTSPHVFPPDLQLPVPLEPVFYSPSFLVGSAAVICVVGVTALRFISIREGGSSYVATLLKAEPLGESPLFLEPKAKIQEKIIRNIVSEICLAASMTEPDIYLLLYDESINAMATGLDPDDSAIIITKGTLRLLDRDELSALLAHEFSHLVNGDTRLYTVMVGYLTGLFFFNSASAWLASHYPNALTVILAFLGKIVGSLATFSGKILRAAVSRSREYMADASAALYTRDHLALARVLKKIGGQVSPLRPAIQDYQPVSHFFLVNPEMKTLAGRAPSFSLSLDSHPPLADRIKALDPDWDGQYWDFKKNPVDYLTVKPGQWGSYL